MPGDPDPVEIQHDEANHRFYADLGSAHAELVYRRAGQSTLILVHTAVPAAFERRGIGGRLARTALEYARANGLAVVPRCAFVAGFIRRNPEYADLVK